MGTFYKTVDCIPNSDYHFIRGGLRAEKGSRSYDVRVAQACLVIVWNGIGFVRESSGIRHSTPKLETNIEQLKGVRGHLRSSENSRHKEWNIFFEIFDEQ